MRIIILKFFYDDLESSYDNFDDSDDEEWIKAMRLMLFENVFFEKVISKKCISERAILKMSFIKEQFQICLF